MSTNLFIGQAKEPDEAEVRAALSANYSLWDTALQLLAEECGLHTREWNSYSRKVGWSLRLKHKGRNILYLLPNSDGVLAAFVLGDRGIEAARAAELPQNVLAAIDGAKKYAEGTGFRFPIDGPEALEAMKKLVAIKMAH